MNRNETSTTPLPVRSNDELVAGAGAGINFLEFCENYVTENGGKVVRSGRLAHGELNGFIYPARTAEDIFWNETLYTPSGLAALCGLKRKAPNVEVSGRRLLACPS